tara:strand:- start:271 stop:453 length:183 start_codon:yes stop_codon:yes gene_type:complete
MVSFARVRTRSLLSKLWPMTVKPINNDIADLEEPIGIVEMQQRQNNSFLEITKNGGFWFS